MAKATDAKRDPDWLVARMRSHLEEQNEGLEGDEPHQIIHHLHDQVAPGPGAPLVVQHGFGGWVGKHPQPTDVVVVPTDSKPRKDVHLRPAKFGYIMHDGAQNRWASLPPP